MSALPVILDTFTRVTPLGVRFWDPVLEMVVSDGLIVTAYPPGFRFLRVSAFTTPGGVYAFRGLPGLSAAERGAGDAAYWAKPPVQRSFVIEVSDPAGRYQPFALSAELPLRGVYAWNCGGAASPPASPIAPGPPAVPLFSAPSRDAPAGMAAVRAALWDPIADTAAARAVLEVTPPGQPPARGIADSQGRVVVLFPYPEPIAPPAAPGSPLPGSAVPLAQQQWTVTLMASYTPGLLSSPAPDLCATLRQPPATLWATWADSPPRAPLTEASLTFGQELVLRTAGAAGAALPVLYVTAAASPP
jgi:hypothetical protein